MNKFVVQKSIDVRSQPEAVWDALTNPEKTKKYFFDCAVYSDWRAGSPIQFKGKILLVKKIEMNGTILEIVPGKLLKYTLTNEQSDDPSTQSMVTDRLSYANGITTLTITDDVGDGEGARARFEKSETGWDKVLTGLKELVEKENEIDEQYSDGSASAFEGK